ncbi:MAG: ABC transporter permease, partial [Planctomycetota bacterium]
MIGTVIWTHFQRLVHNRVELLLTFVVPIAFFCIFALILGGGVGSTPRFNVVLVDEATNDDSLSVLDELRENAGLRVMNEADQALPSRDQATEMIRRGTASLAIILKSDQKDGLKADLLADTSDQVSGQIVSAMVSRTLITSNLKRSANPFGDALLGPEGAAEGTTVGQITNQYSASPAKPEDD